MDDDQDRNTVVMALLDALAFRAQDGECTWCRNGCECLDHKIDREMTGKYTRLLEKLAVIPPGSAVA